jgi:hypothetical protein
MEKAYGKPGRSLIVKTDDFNPLMLFKSAQPFILVRNITGKLLTKSRMSTWRSWLPQPVPIIGLV